MNKIKVITRKLPGYYVFRKKMKGIRLTGLEDMFYYDCIKDYIKYWRRKR